MTFHHDSATIKWRIFYHYLFHERSFIMKDGKWAPNWKYVMRVKDVLAPFGGEKKLKNLEKDCRAKLHDIQALLAASRRAHDGELKQHRAELSPQSKALCCVETNFQHKDNNELLADGGNTYVEFTRSSIDKLLEGIKVHIKICASDIFVDGGCGYNFMMAYIAQETGCKVYGIEYVSTKVFLGTVLALWALSTNELTNHKIMYVPSNMCSLESLGPATIAIFFDEAFTDSLLNHICTQLVKPSTTLRATVFFKAGKCRTLIKDIEC